MAELIIDHIEANGNVYAFVDSKSRTDISDLANRVTMLNNNQTEAVNNEKTRAMQQEQAIDNAKVDKVAGKGLSSNDFTNAYKDAIDNPTPFEGATASLNGHAGSVPAPLIADRNAFLKGDGTWGTFSTKDELAMSHTESGNTITEVFGDGVTVTTTFNANGSVTEEYSQGGVTMFTLTTTFGSDGSITRTRS